MEIFAEQELEEVINLEKSLLHPAIRKSRSLLSTLLEQDFFEIASSGAVLRREDVLSKLPLVAEESVEGFDFDGIFLSMSTAHITYKTKHTKGAEVRWVLRSSIWELNSDGWQMLFHQGTPLLKP